MESGALGWYSALLFAGAMVCAGCAGLPARSERQLEALEVASLTPGIDRAQLFQRIGPPAEEGAYPNLEETVASWRLIEAGGQRMLFTAHFDPSGRVKYYSRELDPASVSSDSSGGP